MNRTLFAVRNLADKMDKMLRDPNLFAFYVRTYIFSRFEHIEPDCYIVSYPKCGRTWLRMMLKMYAQLEVDSAPSLSDGSLMALGNIIIRFSHDQSGWVPAPAPINRLSFDHKQYSGKKVIFLVRDPRDVLVSSWYQVFYRDRAYRHDLSTMAGEDLLGIEKIVAFMNMWMQNRHIPSDFLLVRYEQMKADTVGSLEQVLRFLDIDASTESVQAAVEASKFEKMKRLEESSTVREPWLQEGLRKTGSDAAMKVRKGVVGGYREEFTQEDLAYINQVLQQKLTPDLPYQNPS